MSIFAKPSLSSFFESPSGFGSVRRKRQRGFVLITMAVATIAILGTMGLAIDMGRLFIVKNETQAYVDAAAIAAALQLDGTSQGITDATNAATGMVDKWNFSTTTIASPTVEFATSSAGSWSTAPASPVGITYARVTVTVAPNLYFIPAVMVNQVYTQNIASRAVAGQVAIAASTSIPEGLGPFAGVASCSGTVADCETTANFGYTVGNEYDIQWPQYNSHRKNCGNGNGQLDNCFVQPTCANETTAAKQEVVQYWGSSINGYWGSNSTSQLNSYILDKTQLQAVAIGTDLQPLLSSGNKQGTAKIVDDRVNEDPINYGNNLTTYLANSSHNGRRLIPAPVVYPSDAGGGVSQSIVVGYGLFFLESDQSSAGSSSGFYQGGTGNDPYCAIYAGPWNMGSQNAGANTTSGASRVRLVQ